MGPGPILTSRSPSSSLTMWWASPWPAAPCALAHLGSLQSCTAPVLRPRGDAHLGRVGRDSLLGFLTHLCSCFELLALFFQMRKVSPQAASFTSCVGRGRTDWKVFRNQVMLFLPFGRKTENLSRVTRILINNVLSLQLHHDGNCSPLSQGLGTYRLEVPGHSKHVYVSLEGKRHEKTPPWHLPKCRRHVLFTLLVTDTDGARSVFM